MGDTPKVADLNTQDIVNEKPHSKRKHEEVEKDGENGETIEVTRPEEGTIENGETLEATKPDEEVVKDGEPLEVAKPDGTVENGETREVKKPEEDGTVENGETIEVKKPEEDGTIENGETTEATKPGEDDDEEMMDAPPLIDDEMTPPVLDDDDEDEDEDDNIMLPFALGWTRELIHKPLRGDGIIMSCNVNYIAPAKYQSKRLTIKTLKPFLTKQKITNVKRINFDFRKELIGAGEPRESEIHIARSEGKKGWIEKHKSKWL